MRVIWNVERFSTSQIPPSPELLHSSPFTLSLKPFAFPRRGCAAARQFFAPCTVHRPCNSLPFHGIRHYRLPRRARPVRRELAH